MRTHYHTDCTSDIHNDNTLAYNNDGVCVYSNCQASSVSADVMGICPGGNVPH